ncbi:extracellular dioxygenase-like protein [Lojkania enalia]|uniref:Extracellular dioxygenase-like protein n=1 Tax=Lojkania enalia TaxID=147567 RepID=A0A9P4KHF1_9PLEO|nr:extracellular dioxygenase-like protein [Didymosphaeria enalia]
MVAFSKSLVFSAAIFSLGCLAHPGHNVQSEVAQRAQYMAGIERRSLEHCAEKLEKLGATRRSIARRHAMVEKLRAKRAVEVRDIGEVLNTSHHSTQGYTSETPADILFAGNASCILSPEVTEGPYYVTGELVRQNVVEKEPGVPLTYEVQMIDFKTCEPLPDVLLEMWHCNSTGVYGGIAGGNAGGVTDERELNNTMLRGIQPSDNDGVVIFDTIFPGHYIGRTPHIHVMAHINATVLPNNTISGGTVSHVGQLFFDQTLITEVELTSPYSTNTQPLTTNAGDFIMAQEAENGDPVLQYTYLGSKVEDGLFGWIAFGVDPTANRTVNAAANYGQDGGHANPNPGFPGGPGGPFPTGGFPGFPSGFPSGFPFPTNFPGPTAVPSTSQVTEE